MIRRKKTLALVRIVFLAMFVPEGRAGDLLTLNSHTVAPPRLKSYTLSHSPMGSTVCACLHLSRCSVGHNLEYQFDWGDGTISLWGSNCRCHTYWAMPGTAGARARCQVDTSVVSAWSSLTVSLPPPSLPRIVSAEPSQFNRQARQVEIQVSNPDEPRTLTLQMDSKPDGWSVSPVSVSLSLAANESRFIPVDVQPPTAESNGNITWKLYHGTNVVDTFEQPVSNHVLRADANGDCIVDILDLLFVRNRLGQDVDSDDNHFADVNGDEIINILDLVHVRNRIGEGCE